MLSLGGLAGCASGSVLLLDSEASLTAPHAIKPIATTATAPPPIYSLCLQAHLQQLFAVSMYSLKPHFIFVVSQYSVISSFTASLDCSAAVPVICSILRLLHAGRVRKVIDISSAISFFHVLNIQITSNTFSEIFLLKIFIRLLSNTINV